MVCSKGDDKNCKRNKMSAGCKNRKSSPHYNEMALQENEISRRELVEVLAKPFIAKQIRWLRGAKTAKVLRIIMRLLCKKMRSAGGKLVGCFSRAVFLLVFGGLPINGAGNVRSCAGNRTHSAGLTRVYTKIEKSGPRVFVIQFVTFSKSRRVVL